MSTPSSSRNVRGLTAIPNVRTPSELCEQRTASRAFTLIEILIVVVLLGIAGALIVPATTQIHVLRIQGALRTTVADITYAQSDAIAFQERRLVRFDAENSTYSLYYVPGNSIVATPSNLMFNPERPDGRYIVDFRENRFGDARITSADFDGNGDLLFDALGGPIVDPANETPGAGGSVRITGSGQTFDILVEPFTGRIRVERVNAGAGDEDEEPPMGG